MTSAEFQERAPTGDALTDYDRAHASLYLRLLDAETAGADWREIVPLLFGLDVASDPKRAEDMHATHLARAKWLRDGAHKGLFSQPKS